MPKNDNNNKQNKKSTKNKRSKKENSLEIVDFTDTSKDIPFNLNLNNSDEFTPDYLFCWNLFKRKPIKDSFFSYFDTKMFFDWISTEMNITQHNIKRNNDIISDMDIYLINSKYLIKVSDTIYLSLIQYTEIYKDNADESYDDDDKIGAIHIYSKSEQDFEIVQQIKDKLFDFEIDPFGEEDDHKQKDSGLRILKFDADGNKFSSIPIDIKSDINMKHFEKFYSKDTFKQTKKLIKKLNSNVKGLTILYGGRGSGKTSMLSYFSTKITKKIIFIPSNVIEHTLYNTEFIEFLKYNTNSILIYDDCENYITSKMTISNVLSLTDGMLSNLFNCNVVLSYNVSNVNLIDEDLIDSNNLIDVIEFKDLDKKEANELSLELNLKEHNKSNKLINILKEKRKYTNKIGF